MVSDELPQSRQWDGTCNPHCLRRVKFKKPHLSLQKKTELVGFGDYTPAAMGSYDMGEDGE